MIPKVGNMTDFGNVLKEWRGHRRMSQMDLALNADVSSRHISFLETGRSRPSRDMVLHLADCLQVPKVDVNRLLAMAGFVAHHPILTRDDDNLKPIHDAIDRMIFSHDPYPAIVLDKLWTVLKMNRSATMLFGAAGLTAGTSMLSLMRDLEFVEGLIENWGEVGYHTLSRLRIESAQAGGLPELDEVAAIIASSPAVKDFERPTELPPVIPAIYRAGGQRLSLFSTFTQFGTAEEINLSETKIEMMFPADAATTELLTNLPVSN